MDIKDLAGFGKIFGKFMDVCSLGIGKVMEPRQIRKIAEAKAYEIEKITEALLESKKKLNSSISYENGEVKVLVDKADKEQIENVEVIENIPKQLTTTPNIDFIEESSENIEKALKDREFYKNIKKDKNIYDTLNHTINEFENVKEEEISDEKVSEDWILRYFDTIEDISNEHLQILWAKILAGEIKKPNTYSLRTLELLKNLSFQEAELFSKIGNLCIQNVPKDKCFFLSDKNILKNFNVTFEEIVILQDLDLIHPRELRFLFDKPEEDVSTFLIYGKELFKLDLKKEVEISLNVYYLTSVGKELLNLVDRIQITEYKKEIAKLLKNNTPTKVYSTFFINQEQGSYNISSFEEII